MEKYYINIVSNLDRYNSSHFPALPVIPRIGECVSVSPEYVNYFINSGYPSILEVTNVIYYENRIEVIVWYSDIQLQNLRIKNKEL